MKRKLLLFTLIISCCCYSVIGFAQTKTENGKAYRSKNKLKLKPKEIKKLTFIQLEGRDKKFPDSYLLGMRDNNLILATDIAEKWTDKSLYVKSEINLKYYDHLTMVNQKEKHRKMAIWGAVFGAAGYYFAQKKSQATPFELRNKTILGQPPHSGIIEGIMGGITGVGFGIIIGTQLAKRRINLKSQKTKAVRKLKEFSFYD